MSKIKTGSIPVAATMENIENLLNTVTARFIYAFGVQSRSKNKTYQDLILLCQKDKECMDYLVSKYTSTKNAYYAVIVVDALGSCAVVTPGGRPDIERNKLIIDSHSRKSKLSKI